MREKHLLLILDNCEHVVEASAKVAGQLLRNAPGLQILATSRVHLNLPGEVIYPVPPLALPDPGRSLPALALVQYEAIRLFIERATSLQPPFCITNENASAVVQICTHLDGIPLAIELAAARTRLLSPDQISARLGDRFNLLTGGSRTALPRQQTLRAAMDWSYDLLSEAERTLFNRLAVFAGSFSLESAEVICSNENVIEMQYRAIQPSQVLDLLGALVDHSLVMVQERNAQARYILLETVRQYALEKLQATSEGQILQERHLAYYLKLAQQGELGVRIFQPAWMERFETDFDNLRAAMEYAIAYQPESAILFEYPLDWFCGNTSRSRESYGWAMRILALTETWPPGKMRTMALWHAGNGISVAMRDHQQGQVLMEAGLEMARELGDKNLEKNILRDLAAFSSREDDFVKMRDFAEKLLAVSQELGDKVSITAAQYQLGVAVRGMGDLMTGRLFLEQSLEMARQENFPSVIGNALRSLARVAILEGDNAKAEELLIECVQFRRQIGEKEQLALTLIELGQVLLKEGDSVQTSKLFEESLVISKELKMEDSQVHCLAGFAGAAGNAGRAELAARLFGASEAAAERIDLKMDDFDHAAYDPIIAAVREKLGEAVFNAAWSEGRKLTLEQAIEFAHL